MTTRLRHLLVDRDGVLNVEVARVASRADWAWIPGSLEALARLGAAGVRVSVITNQSAIGRGEVSEASIATLHASLVDEVAATGGCIDGFFVCPHAADVGCACRKPRPELLLQAIAVSAIPPTETMMVGDMPRDLEAGRAAGVEIAVVRTGKGRATEASWPGVRAFDDLAHLVYEVADLAEVAS